MPCDFETADCFGTRVVGSHARWNGHVLDRHDELAEHRGQIIRALAEPLMVYQSIGRPNRRLFYTTPMPPASLPERYILVIVAYDQEDGGEVGTLVTAYPTEVIKEGNLLILEMI